MAYTFKHGDRPLAGITIQRAVGRGGFGEVYYAVSDAGKQLALKYLREHADTELRGVSEVMNLKSPHLVTIYDVQRNPNNEIFVLMEYIGGPSLAEVLRAEDGPLDPAQVVYFLSGIAQGLAYLHDRGIVHRDLKPGNIFYDDGYVKIGDYGLSKHMTTSKHSGQTVSVGTVHYMAPEIGTGSYTQLVDVYALGVILYEMLAGRPPFVGASFQEVLVRQMRDEPDTSVLPAEFVPIVSKALAKDPQERYQSANEFMDAVAHQIELDTRLSQFDPLTLTQITRAELPEPVPVTLTTPVVLDARAPADGPRLAYARRTPPPYRDRYPPPRPESFLVPLGTVVGLEGVAVLFALLAGLSGGEFSNGLRALLLAIAVVPGSVLLYRWWSTLPAGWRRTTPARAVGFCFIPMFNLYWFYVALHGLINDLNRYREAFAPRMRRLSHKPLLAFWVLFVVSGALAEEANPSPLLGLAVAAAVAANIVFMVSTTSLCQSLLRQVRRAHFTKAQCRGVAIGAAIRPRAGLIDVRRNCRALRVQTWRSPD